MTRGLPVVLACLLLTAGCKCRNMDPVSPVELGLNVTPAEVDFGRVLQGDSKTLQVTLGARTRASIDLTLTTAAPFSVSPDSLTVPGGSSEVVDVTFLAGDMAVEGTLEIHVGDQLAVVALRGVGVAPLDCIPSAECIISTYSLEEDRCIETQAPDETGCDPGSVCLEQGRCRSGACLGIARSCDDRNPCTDDACAIDAGCITTPHACPGPTMACTVATCDPTSGCGFGPAPDFSICGPSDCITVQFCQSGACLSVAAPEGLTCGPPVACLPEAKCHDQKCERDAEGEWQPEWSARMPLEPLSPIASVNGTLFLSVCAPDAGIDAGVVDGGDADGGDADAGLDAGEPDAAVPLVCGLTSITSTGFERFTLAYDDALPRQLISARAAGVVLFRDGGIEVRSTTTGEVAADLEFTGRADQVVISSSSISVIRDGGLFVWSSDAGLTQLATADDAAELAHGQIFFSWNASTQTLTRYLETDAGLQLEALSLADAGRGLAVTDELAVLGASGVMTPDASFIAFPAPDGGVVLPSRTLLSSPVADVFDVRCDAGACAEWVRAVDMSTGLVRWEANVHPALPRSTTLATTLVSVSAGSLVALIREERDGGVGTYAELINEGDRIGVCHLPPQSGNVELAHFSSTSMVVTTRRADGGLVIESYPLNSLPVSQFGWPTENGVRGTRNDRP